jgi:enamine deaminase RidA (YjgF/YER057c/UK114 family)
MSQPPEKPGAPPPPGPPTAPVWRAVNPPTWAPPVGYANAVVSRGTTRVAVAGQIAFGPDAKVRHQGDLVAQAALAFDNVVTVLAAAGARPEHVVRLRLFVTSATDYARHAADIGRAYRARFGRWFPAMTLVEVSRLYEADALVEVEADAEVP